MRTRPVQYYVEKKNMEINKKIINILVSSATDTKFKYTQIKKKWRILFN